MEKLVLSTEEFSELLTLLKGIDKKLTVKNEKPEINWIDNSDLMRLLKVSRRTVQSWRDSNLISYSIVGNKLYYRMEDVEALLNRYHHKSLGK